MFIRKQKFEELGAETAFLWGARQTGKTTLLKMLYPDSLFIDLLLNDVFMRYRSNPSLLREVVQARKDQSVIILDEIQRIPELLNEVQWLITNTKAQFILSGSSPRKILREGHNLLGGRALRYELYPLVYPEIDDFDILRALENGLIPRHYLAANPERLLESYIGSYLKDEIIAEARIRNIESFTQFLDKAAYCNGELINYSNIAADCGVSSPTIKEYFHILEDTLIGRFMPSWQKKQGRRTISAPKFWFFDLGIANHLLKRRRMIQKDTSGKVFEHFIYQEIYAHSRYSSLNYDINYWRTASQIEVDFVLGGGEVAVEVKSTNNAQPRHYKGLIQFASEYKVKKLILVTNDPLPRKTGQISIMPWKSFLEELWGGSIIQ